MPAFVCEVPKNPNLAHIHLAVKLQSNATNENMYQRLHIPTFLNCEKKAKSYFIGVCTDTYVIYQSVLEKKTLELAIHK